MRGGSRRGGRRPARDDYDDYDDSEDRSSRRPARRGGRRARRGGGSSQGTTIFVLGLLGLILCPVLGPIAWMMGRGEIDRCRRNRETPDGLLSAGTVMGLIATIFIGVSILVTIFVMLAGAAGGP